MMRTKIAAVLVVIAAVLAGVGLWVHSRAGGADDPIYRVDGPIHQQGATAYAVSFEREHRFTDGFQVLQLKGAEPATILSVKSVQRGGTLKYLGALIAGPDRRYGMDEVVDGFPPKSENFGPLTPAKGFRLLPDSQLPLHNGYELLLGYQFLRDALSVRPGIIVRYEVAGVKYHVRIPATVVTCPSGRDTRSCLDEVHH